MRISIFTNLSSTIAHPSQRLSRGIHLLTLIQLLINFPQQIRLPSHLNSITLPNTPSPKRRLPGYKRYHRRCVVVLGRCLCVAELLVGQAVGHFLFLDSKRFGVLYVSILAFR